MADPGAAAEATGVAWLAEATVAVVGLGLMGGSLAGALRGGLTGAPLCRHVIGVVRRTEILPAAASWVDEATTSFDALEAADVVVLATPPRTILRLLPEIAARLRPGTLLMDLGSTKRAIVSVMSSLPGGLLVVGGHPMCGKEAGGLAAADPRLYQNAPFVLCPVAGGPELALARATTLARAVGAQPHILDAHAHDRAVAAISHLPYTTAVALVLAAEELAGPDPDSVVWKLAAGGFRDTTRVAAGELEMWIDILLTNRDEVLAHLNRLTGALQRVATAVEQNDGAGLQATLATAQRRRRTLFR